MLIKIESLIKLQEIDALIKKLETEKKKIPSILSDYEQKIKSQKEVLEITKNNMLTKQLEKKNLELELSNIEETIKKHNIELNSVKSNDRYRAVIDAIKSEKQKKSDLEDNILSDFDDVDTINIDLAKEKENVKILEDEFNQKKAELDKKIAELEKTIQDLLSQKKEVEDSIDDKHLVDFYNRIRTHQAGIGLAEVDMVTSSCKACNVYLPFQKINDIISSKQPTLCENCSRILYVLEKEKKEEN